MEGRTYDIADCSPNVLELLPLLMEKASRVILKLSPMFDWHRAVEALKYVEEVHIVSVDNECKELLMVLGGRLSEGLRLCCVNGDQYFEVFPLRCDALSFEASVPLPVSETVFHLEHHRFLYEPNASIMKAGCFGELARSFRVTPVAQNSHLFLSPVEIDDFPGRSFQIQAISSVNKKELIQKAGSVERANISVRNFPLSADQLRKKLKLKDGGDVYLFATTLHDGQHRLFICRKIS